MEDFRARQFVNGATIRSYLNKPVSVFVKVESVESAGMTIKGQTTDQRSISVILSEPVNNSLKDQWIEADGMAISQDTVKCEKAVTFGAAGPEDEAFDTDAHNLLVHFLNNDPETLYRMN